MNTEIFLNNVARYSLQVGLLIGVAAFLPPLLRMRHPGARLAFWHVLLATCLILPVVQPITPNIIVISRPVASVPITSTATSVAVSSGPEFRTSDILLALLAAGVLARLAWLALGFWRLRHYRRESVSLNEADGWTYEAEVRISSQIASPVTFGVRKPVVLLPSGFPALHPLVREAILCHECMHVRRRDWAFIVVEELVRAALWFHPAIWWLLEEIQLTREQAVDRAAVEVTKAKDEYVDALLSVATAKPALDLAPAPLFLRKRHLKRRVVSILKEAQMTKKKLYAALAAALCLTAAACWLVCGAFPLAAAPQVAMDAPGVTVDLGSAGLLHRTPVQYPAAAMASHTEGVVIVEATLDKAGNVTDARVMSGPEALRRTALESVLQWHFAPVGAGATRQVSIAFSAPEPVSGFGAGVGEGGGFGGGVLRVGNGVSAPTILQKVEPQYSEEARKAKYAGTVVLSVVVMPDGHADEIRVQRSLGLGLDEEAVKAVQQWRFRPGMKDGQPVPVAATIEVNFRPSAEAGSGAGLQQYGAVTLVPGAILSTAPVRETANNNLVGAGSGAGLQQYGAVTLGPGTILSTAPVRETANNNLVGSTVSDILVLNLTEQARAELLSRLPVHQGDVLAADSLARLTAAAREFDEHLTVSLTWRVGPGSGPSGVVVVIAPSVSRTMATGGVLGAVTTMTSSGAISPPAGATAPPPGVQTIKVGANVQAANLIKKVSPVYPPLAKQARIQGHVILSVVIGRDGTIQDMKVSSGHPLLVQAAMEAVRQWQYKPTMLNGNPVEVSTDVDVNFTLDEGAPTPPQQ